MLTYAEECPHTHTGTWQYQQRRSWCRSDVDTYRSDLQAYSDLRQRESLVAAVLHLVICRCDVDTYRSDLQAYSDLQVYSDLSCLRSEYAGLLGPTGLLGPQAA